MRKEIAQWLIAVAAAARHPATCRTVAAAATAAALLLGAAGCTPEGEAYLDARREGVRKQCASSLTPQVQALCKRLGLPVEPPPVP